MEVFRTKPTILECHVNDPDAPVKWFKNGIPIDVSFQILRFSSCVLYQIKDRLIIRILNDRGVPPPYEIF